MSDSDSGVADSDELPDEIDPEQIDLADDPSKNLIELLSLFPRIIGSSPTPIKDGSRMHTDRNAAPELISLPNLCQHYISGANDFLATLEQILPVESGEVFVPRYSAYPLLRGVIESSGQAAWVLGPSDQRERFVRLLRIQKAELDYDRRYVAATVSTSAFHKDDTREMRSQLNKLQRGAKESRERQMNRLLDIASMLKINKREFEHGLNPGGYESLIYQTYLEAHLADGNLSENECHWLGRYAASVWLFISGLSHPSVSRAWANADGGRPDGTLVAVETAANPLIVRNTLIVALRLQMRAFVALRS